MEPTDIAKLLGKRGGKKTVEMHGKKHFIEAQKKSVEARRRNKLIREQQKKLSTE